MKTIHPVRVTWVDSTARSGWNAQDEVSELADDSMECISVGFLMEKRRDRVVLAQSYSEGTLEIGHVLAIPRCAVKSIMPLVTE